jgi:hypothetical protein
VKTETKKSSIAIIMMQRNLLFFMCIFFFVTTLAVTILAVRKESITLFQAPEVKLDLSGAKAQAEFLSHLILNRSVLNAKEQDEHLLPWIDPIYSFDFKKHLKRMSKQMEENQITFEWTLLDSTLEKLDDFAVRVYLNGNLSLYLPLQDQKKQLVEEELATLVMDLSLKNGKLLLNNFNKETQKK